MTLGVDLRCLPEDGSPGRGVEHASRELWSALCEHAAEYDITCLGFVPQGAVVSHESSVFRLSGTRGKDLRTALKRQSIDVLLVPSGAVPLGISVPCYPWVHDCAIFEHPEWFPQSWLKRQLTTRLFLRGLRRAPQIFTISEATKREVEALLPQTKDRLTVTGQGVIASAKQMGSSLIPHPYLLMLGPTEGRKNVAFALDLWSRLRPILERQGVSFVVAGPKGWDDRRPPHAWEGVKRMERVTDQERDLLLQHATLLLIPSLHEGFSRVALEGISFGIPVVTSDRGALPEVIGDGGICLPLERPEMWEKVVLSIVNGEGSINDLKSQALQQSQRFSWEKTAKIMLAKIALR